VDDEESSGSRILSSDLDAKMDLIRSVLDGQVLTEEEKEACIQQFLSIQNKHVEMVESLQHTQRDHQRVRLSYLVIRSVLKFIVKLR